MLVGERASGISAACAALRGTLIVKEGGPVSFPPREAGSTVQAPGSEGGGRCSVQGATAVIECPVGQKAWGSAGHMGNRDRKRRRHVKEFNPFSRGIGAFRPAGLAGRLSGGAAVTLRRRRDAAAAALPLPAARDTVWKQGFEQGHPPCAKQ